MLWDQRATRLRIGGVSLALVTILSSGCYVTQQGIGQLQLLRASIPLEQAIATEPNADYRDMLELVERVLTYCAEELHLDTKKNYRTYYRTDQDAITQVVTASAALELTPYEWHFLIVGRVPYKGFFDPADATQLARALEAAGYDVWVGGVPAYSTLGWFADPITTPMLKRGVYYLVDTIIHELVHATLYVAGQGNFNEQLASFVAATATPAFFTRYHPRGTEIIAAQEVAAARAEQFFTLMQDGYQQARALYSDPTTTDQHKLTSRRELFATISAQIRALYPTISERQATVNNARLLQARRYRQDHPVFQRIWHESAGDWGAFWQTVTQYEQEYGAANLDRW